MKKLLFNIEFIDRPSWDEERDDHYIYAKITIGEFTEILQISLWHWTIDEYVRHWKDAYVRIKDKPNCSYAFVTQMYDPQNFEYIRVWPVYREGDKVYFHEMLLLSENIGSQFDINKLSEYVGDREVENDNGAKPSEWSLTSKDFIESNGFADDLKVSIS